MSNFSHQASGRLCASSWVSYKIERFYLTKYAERDVVYDRRKAARGVLEQVAIKRVEFAAGSFAGGQLIPLYVDTYNSHWRENMLIEQAEAVSSAQDYYTMRIAEAEEEMRRNGNSCLP